MHTALIMLWFLLFIFLPFTGIGDPSTQNLTQRFLPLSLAHPLGTDSLGRDVLSRLLYGGRMSLGLSMLIVLCTAMIGTFLGVSSVFLDERKSKWWQSALDFFLSLPSLAVAISLIGILGPTIENLLLALCVTHWAEYARATSSWVATELKMPYVSYAAFCGLHKRQVLWREVFPNILSQLLLLTCQNFADVLLTIAGLSLIGIGVPMQYPEWGTMLMSARSYLQTEPLLMIFPGLAIFLTVLFLNLWSDATRDLLDPYKHNA